jgi:hypothetical protein
MARGVPLKSGQLQNCQSAINFGVSSRRHPASAKRFARKTDFVAGGSDFARLSSCRGQRRLRGCVRIGILDASDTSTTITTTRNPKILRRVRDGPGANPNPAAADSRSRGVRRGTNQSGRR